MSAPDTNMEKMADSSSEQGTDLKPTMEKSCPNEDKTNKISEKKSGDNVVESDGNDNTDKKSRDNVVDGYDNTDKKSRDNVVDGYDNTDKKSQDNAIDGYDTDKKSQDNTVDGEDNIDKKEKTVECDDNTPKKSQNNAVEGDNDKKCHDNGVEGDDNNDKKCHDNGVEGDNDDDKKCHGNTVQGDENDNTDKKSQDNCVEGSNTDKKSEDKAVESDCNDSTDKESQEKAVEGDDNVQKDDDGECIGSSHSSGVTEAKDGLNQNGKSRNIEQDIEMNHRASGNSVHNGKKNKTAKKDIKIEQKQKKRSKMVSNIEEEIEELARVIEATNSDTSAKAKKPGQVKKESEIAKSEVQKSDAGITAPVSKNRRKKKNAASTDDKNNSPGNSDVTMDTHTRNYSQFEADVNLLIHESRKQTDNISGESCSNPDVEGELGLEQNKHETKDTKSSSETCSSRRRRRKKNKMSKIENDQSSETSENVITHNTELEGEHEFIPPGFNAMAARLSEAIDCKIKERDRPDLTTVSETPVEKSNESNANKERQTDRLEMMYSRLSPQQNISRSILNERKTNTQTRTVQSCTQPRFISMINKPELVVKEGIGLTTVDTLLGTESASTSCQITALQDTEVGQQQTETSTTLESKGDCANDGSKLTGRPVVGAEGVASSSTTLESNGDCANDGSKLTGHPVVGAEGVASSSTTLESNGDCANDGSKFIGHPVVGAEGGASSSISQEVETQTSISEDGGGYFNNNIHNRNWMYHLQNFHWGMREDTDWAFIYLDSDGSICSDELEMERQQDLEDEDEDIEGRGEAVGASTEHNYSMEELESTSDENTGKMSEKADSSEWNLQKLMEPNNLLADIEEEPKDDIEPEVAAPQISLAEAVSQKSLVSHPIHTLTNPHFITGSECDGKLSKTDDCLIGNESKPVMLAGNLSDSVDVVCGGGDKETDGDTSVKLTKDGLVTDNQLGEIPDKDKDTKVGADGDTTDNAKDIKVGADGKTTDNAKDTKVGTDGETADNAKDTKVGADGDTTDNAKDIKVGADGKTSDNAKDTKVGADGKTSDNAKDTKVGADEKTTDAKVGADGKTTDNVEDTKVGADGDTTDNAKDIKVGADGKTSDNAKDTKVGADGKTTDTKVGADGKTTDNVEDTKVGADGDTTDNAKDTKVGADGKTSDNAKDTKVGADGDTTDNAKDIKVGADGKTSDNAKDTKVGADGKTTDNVDTKVGADGDTTDNAKDIKVGADGKTSDNAKDTKVGADGKTTDTKVGADGKTTDNVEDTKVGADGDTTDNAKDTKVGADGKTSDNAKDTKVGADGDTTDNAKDIKVGADGKASDNAKDTKVGADEKTTDAKVGADGKTTDNVEDTKVGADGDTTDNAKDTKVGADGKTSDNAKDTKVGADEKTTDAKVGADGKTTDNVEDTKVGADGDTTDNAKDTKVGADGKTTDNAKDTKVGADGDTTDNAKDTKVGADGKTTDNAKDTKVATDEKTTDNAKDIKVGADGDTTDNATDNSEDTNVGADGDTTDNAKDTKVGTDGETTDNAEDTKVGTDGDTTDNAKDTKVGTDGDTTDNAKDTKVGTDGDTTDNAKDTKVGTDGETTDNAKDTKVGADGETTDRTKDTKVGAYEKTTDRAKDTKVGAYEKTTDRAKDTKVGEDGQITDSAKDKKAQITDRDEHSWSNNVDKETCITNESVDIPKCSQKNTISKETTNAQCHEDQSMNDSLDSTLSADETKAIVENNTENDNENLLEAQISDSNDESVGDQNVPKNVEGSRNKEEEIETRQDKDNDNLADLSTERNENGKVNLENNSQSSSSSSCINLSCEIENKMMQNGKNDSLPKTIEKLLEGIESFQEKHTILAKQKLEKVCEDAFLDHDENIVDVPIEFVEVLTNHTEKIDGEETKDKGITHSSHLDNHGNCTDSDNGKTKEHVVENEMKDFEDRRNDNTVSMIEVDTNGIETPLKHQPTKVDDQHLETGLTAQDDILSGDENIKQKDVTSSNDREPETSQNMDSSGTPALTKESNSPSIKSDGSLELTPNQMTEHQELKTVSPTDSTKTHEKDSPDTENPINSQDTDSVSSKDLTKLQEIDSLPSIVITGPQDTSVTEMDFTKPHEIKLMYKNDLTQSQNKNSLPLNELINSEKTDMSDSKYLIKSQQIDSINPVDNEKPDEKVSMPPDNSIEHQKLEKLPLDKITNNQDMHSSPPNELTGFQDVHIVHEHQSTISEVVEISSERQIDEHYTSPSNKNTDVGTNKKHRKKQKNIEVDANANRNPPKIDSSPSNKCDESQDINMYSDEMILSQIREVSFETLLDTHSTSSSNNDADLRIKNEHLIQESKTEVAETNLDNNTEQSVHKIDVIISQKSKSKHKKSVKKSSGSKDSQDEDEGGSLRERAIKMLEEEAAEERDDVQITIKKRHGVVDYVITLDADTTVDHSDSLDTMTERIRDQKKPISRIRTENIRSDGQRKINTQDNESGDKSVFKKPLNVPKIPKSAMPTSEHFPPIDPNEPPAVREARLQEKMRLSQAFRKKILAMQNLRRKQKREKLSEKLKKKLSQQQEVVEDPPSDPQDIGECIRRRIAELSARTENNEREIRHIQRVLGQSDFPRTETGKIVPHCLHCGRLETKLRKCGRCGVAKYCCKNCQCDNYSEHRERCFNLSKWSRAQREIPPIVHHHMAIHYMKLVRRLKFVPDPFIASEGCRRCLLAKVTARYYHGDWIACVIEDMAGDEAVVVFFTPNNDYYQPGHIPPQYRNQTAVVMPFKFGVTPIHLMKCLLPEMFIVIVGACWNRLDDGSAVIPVYNLDHVYFIDTFCEIDISKSIEAAERKAAAETDV